VVHSISVDVPITVDIMSTHDQVLGGPHGQIYFGCRFPADQDYADQIAYAGLEVGRRPAREGVLGRASVDFVAVKGDCGWRPYAVEINLRCGGTTHPLFALTALTDGVVSALAGRVGLTAVGDTLEESRARYYEVKAALDEAAGVARYDEEVS
jgi:hypothetical protein